VVRRAAAGPFGSTTDTTKKLKDEPRIMQDIAPSLQFLLGDRQAIGLRTVWVGLVIFCLEGQMARRAAAVPMSELG
jgi:hypothetical protein